MIIKKFKIQNMKNKIIPVAAGMFFIAFAASCSSNSGKGSSTGLDDLKPVVEIQSVSVEDVAQTGEFPATVEANVTNNISPSTSLRIEKIFVEVGDHVEKGQLLVQMEEDNLAQQSTQLENLKAEYERAEALYEKGGASRSEYDARKTSYEVARTAYDNLAKNTRLLAPISGIVTARNYDGGDMYSGQAVLTIQEITPVKLYINVSESLYTHVRKGMPADIRLDVYGDKVFKGIVTIVYPTIDPSTRTFTVEIKISNEDELVRPGMFAKVTMDFGDRRNVVVPDRAVVKQTGSGQRFVYVYEDGKVYYREVELGRRMGDKYEVISGVNDADKVVVTGQSKLYDGAEAVLSDTKN